MTSATSSAHIPAWKRLGLKLKSTATNTAEPEATNTVSSEPESRKRKRSQRQDSLVHQESSKRIEVASGQETKDPATPELLRKKSVTFTAETKAEDGDSIKQLFNSWAADQKSQDPTWQFQASAPVFTTPTPVQVDEHIDTSIDEKERRVKRVKKSKKEQTTPTTKPTKKSKIAKNTTATSRPFLQYLKQYHECRDTWKFNKNHQSHFLKHIFDLESIPSDHAYLIYPYVRGLQGSVRTRLRDEALAVKIKDIEAGAAGFPESMADKDRRQIEYEAALQEYIATKTTNNPELSLPESGYEEGVLMNLSDFAMKERVAKRLRAEEIIEELATSGDVAQQINGKAPGESGDNTKRLRMNDGTVHRVARKRKQRTATSDSSSSVDSSSDSSEEDETTETNDRTTVSTSSSSSSSSGSSDSTQSTSSSGSSGSAGSTGEEDDSDSDDSSSSDEDSSSSSD